MNRFVVPPVKHIIHIADTHFSVRVSKDVYERETTLDIMNQIIDLAHKTEQPIVVIAGDIMNNNDRGDPFLVQLVMDFVRRLAAICPVFIIAGNHDYNHESHQSWLDLLDFNSNVYYLKESGFYELAESETADRSQTILFGVQAITDSYYSFFAHNPPPSGYRRRIALFHGNVVGAKYMAGASNVVYRYTEPDSDEPNYSYNVNKDWLIPYDVVMLGHIHTAQWVAPNCYYAGSIRQMNCVESIADHGAYIYTVDDNTMTRSLFHPILAHLRLDIRKNDVESILSTLPSYVKYLNVRINNNTQLFSEREKYIEHLQSLLERNANNVQGERKRERDEHDQSVVPSPKIIHTTFVHAEPTEQATDQTLTCTTRATSIWTIESLSWENVFCYGPRHSTITFDKPVVIVSASNMMGKTTIWRILSVALYAGYMTHEPMRSKIANIVRDGEMGVIEFKGRYNADSAVTIIRRFSKNQRQRIDSSILCNGVRQSEEWLKERLIPFNVFDSNYCISRETSCIFDKTNHQFNKYIIQNFQLDVLLDQMNAMKTEMNNHSSAIRSLNTLREECTEHTREELDTLRAQQAQLEEHKPVNTTDGYDRIKYEQVNKRLQTIEKCASEIMLPIPVSCDEYHLIVQYARSSDITLSLVQLWMRYVHQEEKVQKRYEECIRVHEFLNKLVQQKGNLDGIANVLAGNEKYNRLVTCWRELKKYKFVRDVPESNPSEHLPIDQCWRFISVTDHVDAVSASLPFKVSSSPCTCPTPPEKILKLLTSDESNVEMLKMFVRMLDGKGKKVEYKKLMQQLRNSDDAVLLLRAVNSPSCTLYELLEKVYDSVRHQLKTVINNISYNFDRQLYAEIRNKLNQWISVMICSVNTMRQNYEMSYKVWAMEMNELQTKLTKAIDDNEHIARIDRKLTTERDGYEKCKQEFETLNAKYIQIVNSDIKSLEETINNELARYNIRYTVHIESNNKTFSLSIVSKDGGRLVNFTNLSGYERSIMTFLSMQIFNMYSQYSMNMLFIDEAFDVLDTDNYNDHIEELLEIASMYSKNVLFVTHRMIPMHLAYPVRTITSENGKSELV